MTVVVVSTGGTIASTSEDAAGASPTLTGADLVAAVPELDAVADVRTAEFANVPSPHLTVEQMASLAATVREYDDDPDVTGIVVTIGTDVLEEVAYFVDRCYAGETPVAVTGAMRPPSEPSPDGPANLLASVRTVADAGARNRGVLVVFNDRVLPARDATKVHSTNVDTFRAPEFGPIGTVVEDRVTWMRDSGRTTPTRTPAPDDVSRSVHALTITADFPRAQLTAAADADALCLAATGGGHVPPRVADALEALRDRGVPLVATTRCPEGRLLRGTYDFRGSETTLQDVGCLYSDRNLQKTRVDAIVAAATDSFADLFERVS
jgi:L-asparaginase